MMPEIVISPYTFESTNKNFSPASQMFNNNDRNNHVRFKEDGQLQDQLPSLMSPEYDMDENTVNSADLRGLKDAVNYFNKNPIKKINKPSFNGNLSNRSITSQQQQQRYVNNPINDEPQQEIVYSISNSYAQPGIQGTLTTTNDLKQRPVDENIYSQVVASSLRRSNQPEANFDDNEQPLYMNTPYNLTQQAQQNDIQDGSRTSSKNLTSWRDSSL